MPQDSRSHSVLAALVPCTLGTHNPLLSIHALYLTAQSLGLLLQWPSYAHSSTPSPAQPQLYAAQHHAVQRCAVLLPPTAPPTHSLLHWGTSLVHAQYHAYVRLSPHLRLDCCSAISTSSRCVPFLPSSLFLALPSSLSLSSSTVILFPGRGTTHCPSPLLCIRTSLLPELQS